MTASGCWSITALRKEMTLLPYSGYLASSTISTAPACWAMVPKGSGSVAALSSPLPSSARRSGSLGTATDWICSGFKPFFLQQAGGDVIDDRALRHADRHPGQVGGGFQPAVFGSQHAVHGVSLNRRRGRSARSAPGRLCLLYSATETRSLIMPSACPAAINWSRSAAEAAGMKVTFTLLAVK